MSKILLSLLLFTALLAVASCGPKNIPVDFSVTSHFLYKHGSYWVYRDSVSGTYDSFYITSVEQSRSGSSDDKRDYQEISFKMKDGNDSSFFWRIDLLAPNGISINVFLGNEDFGTSFNYYNGDIYSGIDYNGGHPYSSPTILNNTYYNVVRAYTFSRSIFYINDSVGIIKMSFSDTFSHINRTLELARCKIVL